MEYWKNKGGFDQLPVWQLNRCEGVVMLELVSRCSDSDELFRARVESVVDAVRESNESACLDAMLSLHDAFSLRDVDLIPRSVEGVSGLLAEVHHGLVVGNFASIDVATKAVALSVSAMSKMSVGLIVALLADHLEVQFEGDCC